MSAGFEAMDKLESEIAELSARISAATYRLLCCIREFDEQEYWGEYGMRSCAHWLCWRVGLGMVAAREKVRVAHALKELPKTSEALRRGELSYSKVRAITRIATPEMEDDLLQIAKTGTASHVEKLVRAYRRAGAAAEAKHALVQEAERYLNAWYDDAGMLVIQGRLPAEQGARVLKALEAAEGALFRDGRGDDSAETSSRVTAKEVSPPERRADALALVAERSLSEGTERAGGGDRFQVVVHVDAEALAEPDAPGRSELEHGPGIAAQTCRRLACDASVVKMVEGPDGSPLDVGRKTRSIPPALRRALRARDGGCRWPGCTCRIVDAHHINHWADGGETKLENLAELCRRHHGLVHEGGFRMEMQADGGLRFFCPDGTPIPATGTLPPQYANPLALLQTMDEADGLEITPLTAFPDWAGERMDYDLGVELLQNAAGACAESPVARRGPTRPPRHGPWQQLGRSTSGWFVPWS